MNETEKFLAEKSENIKKLTDASELQSMGVDFIARAEKCKYSYNFSWMGRPIIQYPQDIVAMQELIWEVKPDLIIETGIAHGGSIIFYASMLELIGNGEILGIDIDIREHNKEAIEVHPMFKRITMFEGSSIGNEIFERVKEFSKGKEKIMVVLDSNHAHDHVLQELNFYADFVSKDSYLVVFDTIIEDLPVDSFPNRDWDIGDNPKTAVKEFLKSNGDFSVEDDIANKLLITVAPGGYLKRVRK